MTIQLLKSHVIPQTGYGESALSFLRALVAASFEVIVVNDCPGSLRENGILSSNRIYKDIPLLYMTGQHHRYIVEDDLPTVVRTMLETDTIPSRWASKLNRANAVWVPGSFNYNSFKASGIPGERLRIVPEPIQLPTHVDNNDSIPFKTEKAFKFLTVFAADTWYRKGIDCLLKAYFSTFSSSDDVCLVLKTNIRLESLLQHCRIQISPRSPEVEVLDARLPEDRMASLYKHVQAYVLPSRGEGVGRPYLYAMLNRLPVIATGWSGNTDFMNRDNAFLIDYQLQTSPADPRKIHLPQNWGVHYAEPHISHLQETMRHVYQHYEQALQKGLKAEKDIKRIASYQTVARQVKSALNEIDWGKRHLKPLNPFLCMYPLYFPMSDNPITDDDARFSKMPLTSVAIYGTGQAARMAYKWLKRFKQIRKIVFLDRTVRTPRFLRRTVYSFQTFDYRQTQILLVAAAPAYLQDILPNLRQYSSIPIYFFGT